MRSKPGVTRTALEWARRDRIRQVVLAAAFCVVAFTVVYLFMPV